MRYKRKTYAGLVLEQEVYFCADTMKDAPDIERRLARPRTEEEKTAANERHSLKRFIRLLNENFPTGGLYVTLTYDDKNLPEEQKDAENTLRRFIRALRYKFPEARIFAVTGKGTRSGRLHHHLVLFGVWESYIIKKWKHGNVVRIESLRAHNVYNGRDHGRDYTALAKYLWRHGRKRGGKRWIQTKNCRQPEAEPAQEIKRAYSADKPPRTPKGYELVEIYEGKNGYLCFKYVRRL